MKRHAPWIILAVVMVAYLAMTRQQDIAVIQYKGTLLFLSAVAAYWIRRFLISGYRIDPSANLDNTIMASLVIAQAIIFFGCAKALTGI